MQRTFAPETKNISIGRDENNDITLKSLTVSPGHAALSVQSGKLDVRDVNSINGVYVNGAKLRKKWQNLHAGDVLGIGDYTIKVDSIDIPAFAASSGRVKKVVLVCIVLVFAAIVIDVAVEHFESNSKNRKRAPEKVDKIKVSDKKQQAIAELDRAYKIFKQGEKAYFIDDYVEAARCFNKSLKLDPNNLKAQDYLNQIRFAVVDQLVEKGYDLLSKNEYGAVDEVLSELEVYDPASTKYQQLKRCSQGQQKLDKAKQLFYKQQYKQALDLIDGITVLNKASLNEWQSLIKTHLAFEQNMKKAVSLLNKGQAEKAKAILDRFNADIDVPEGQKARIEMLGSVARKLIAFNASKLGSAAHLQWGEWLVENMPKDQMPDLFASLKKQLDENREQLSSRKDEFSKQASSALKQAELFEQEDKPFEVARAKLDALHAYKILDFINPEDEFEAEINKLVKQLSKFVQNEFQQGYILESTGQYEKARKCYSDVLVIDFAENEYYDKAKEKLAGKNLNAAVK